MAETKRNLAPQTLAAVLQAAKESLTHVRQRTLDAPPQALTPSDVQSLKSDIEKLARALDEAERMATSGFHLEGPTGLRYTRPRPSFWQGIAHIFDFPGVLNRYDPGRTPEEADYLAIRSDWETFGQDLRQAIQRFADEHDTELASKS